ncbi:predicted protein [Candida tropicalis MYA-3404]|uniref:F-box domain-containing protein n=1 Tax=Candida tropicalis (strain ATCC MYA-3404 / T1) TaxID=294747 RepID=C5M9X2_CANTT|nr:predicted protein [Candida tropicalis MYA-3404]EER33466.1 predicted protein [Candida tropicalis MYA-3404]KAG4407302.1 hypothetical protein JTP64_002837 [Candida tropicalis]
MGQMSLLDLPPEIIVHIIKCLPREALRQLKDVPELRLYILPILYKNVKLISPRIRDDDIDSSMRYVYSLPFSLPEIEGIGIEELFTIIKNNDVETLGTATITDPYYLFMLHKEYPEALKSTKIIVDFNRFEWVREMDTTLLYFESLDALPYEIIGLHSVNKKHTRPVSHIVVEVPASDSEDDSEDDLEDDLEEIFTELRLEEVPDEDVEENLEDDGSDLQLDIADNPDEGQEVDDMDVASDNESVLGGDNESDIDTLGEPEDDVEAQILSEANFVKPFMSFSQLTSLSIKHLYGSSLQFIPSTIIDLSIDEFHVISVHGTALFPEGLRSLEINQLSKVFPDDDDPVDISYLENLETFQCCSTSEYSLPKNLQSIDAEDSLNLLQLVSECPSLKSIKCLYCKLEGVLNEGLSISNELEVMEIDERFLQNFPKYQLKPFRTRHVGNPDDEMNETVVFKFPERLKNLKLQYASDDRAYEKVQLFSNRPETALSHLTYLCLTVEQNGQCIGQLPPSLRELFIHNSENVNFNILKILNNLTKLIIKYVYLTEFDYDLPDNLREFHFRNNRCEVFKIRAKNLDYLEVQSIHIDKLNDSNFQVPESVTTLSIVCSNIQEIDSSFKFPPNLRQLSLEDNKLSTLPQLPSSLLRLSLQYNKFSELKTPIDLPPNLEELDLSCNHLPDGFIFSNLNLNKLTNLKRLMLQEVDGLFEGNIPMLDLSDLPKSLVELNLNRCRIQRIIGKFSDFPHLEKLDLRSNNNNDNSITELLDIKEDSLEYPYFPDSLKHLWINRLSDNENECEIIDNILKVVLKKPNIITAIVTDKYIDEEGVAHDSMRVFTANDFDRCLEENQWCQFPINFN